MNMRDLPERAHATKIIIQWSDGLRHEWWPNTDGTWTLGLTGPQLPINAPQILGYYGEDMQRVIGTALQHTRWREEGMGTEAEGGLPNPWRWWRERRRDRRR